MRSALVVSGAQAAMRLTRTWLRPWGVRLDDQVIGFLYVGTREGPSKVLPEEPVESLVRYF